MLTMRLAGFGVALALLSAAPAAAQAPTPPYGPPTLLPQPPISPTIGQVCGTTPGNVITNCSFETGDFTGWITTDLTTPFFALSVAGPSSLGYGFFTTAPTDGAVSAIHGFDGDGPGVIEIAQDVVLPANPVLHFDYRAAWDLNTFSVGAMSRTFDVQVQPSGGGAPLQTFLLLTAMGDTINLDTGIQDTILDISGFGGQAVRLAFRWTVPENFTGPGQFEIDNVEAVNASAVPAMPPLGLIGLLLVVGLMAAWLLRRPSAALPAS